ncbi:hypothetical protein [Nitrobacter sp. TKz-YC02]|uniref:hypothetical protein n=1 Tax=Nitrobacter sp. TKz-YC02 TaxID=3398704 RepID=UPI003CF9DB5D
MKTNASSLPGNTPLIDYAVKGLEKCWLPRHGRWSHIYHLDGRAEPNESLPRSDVFYTLNVLLGLSRVSCVPSNLDLRAVFEHNASLLTRLPVAKYAFGMTLWTSGELGVELRGDVLDAVHEILSEKDNWLTFRAQDIGMIVSGVVAQAKRDPARWSALAAELSTFLLARYHCRSGLFFDSAGGIRRRFSSFATNTYLTLACYHYGHFANDPRFIDVANTCARKLISLQGPSGEWPWFFDTPNGRVVDFYEVYSVHQYGMAPAFLECAEQHGVAEARESLIKGFRWVLGDNQLGRPMLLPDLHLTIRSQVRTHELRVNKKRAIRAVTNMALGRSSPLVKPADVTLRLECRSYELGWILWSFGRRTDFPELTGHRIFETATQPIEAFPH